MTVGASRHLPVIAILLAAVILLASAAAAYARYTAPVSSANETRAASILHQLKESPSLKPDGGGPSGLLDRERLMGANLTAVVKAGGAFTVTLRDISDYPQKVALGSAPQSAPAGAARVSGAVAVMVTPEEVHAAVLEVAAW